MYNSRLSVVVPIYNAEDYLIECVESILSQSFSDMEIILLDDGSTDSSGRICDDFAKSESCIKVVHKDNEGLLKTRKKGVEIATGKYVTFVDADDYLKNKHYVRIFEEMIPDVDLFCMDFYFSNGDRYGNCISPGIYDDGKLEQIKRGMIFDYRYQRANIFQSVWSKIFRTDKLRELFSTFPEEYYNVVYCEDSLITTLFLLEKAEKIQISKEDGYVYRVGHTSICGNSYEKTFPQIFLFYKIYKNHIMKLYGDDSDIEKRINLRMAEVIDGIKERNFGVKERDFYYLPDSIRRITGNIILYAAGNVGIDYYEQLQYCKGVNLIKWVDSNPDINSRVETLESKDLRCCDYLIIAVFSKKAAEEVKSSLVSMGVDGNKVIWDEPVVFSGVKRSRVDLY